MANSYSYGTLSNNGILMRYIKTTPNNLAPTYINPTKPLGSTGYYGINGWYFNLTMKIISIAVVNDVPVSGVAGDIEGGWANQEFDRGTLVYDGATGKFSVQIVRRASSLRITNRSNYWAQGGISMGLDLDAGVWEDDARGQNLSLTEKDRRSALVYNKNSSSIWLIVTTDRCTPSVFRSAILNGFGLGTMENGIFLDGGSSTSMRCKEFTLNANNLPEMVRLKNIN